jgi:PncC family amidohydrolase
MPERSLEEQLARLAPAKGVTIATAESCTGGLVAHRITSVAGSSAYYVGGIVSYSNELKRSLLDVPAEILERQGAVSRECALAMARGVRARTGAGVGLSTTGIAGPGGATATKPVGLVYVACVTPWGEAYQELRWDGDRRENIARSAEAALALLLRQLDTPAAAAAPA